MFEIRPATNQSSFKTGNVNISLVKQHFVFMTFCIFITLSAFPCRLPASLKHIRKRPYPSLHTHNLNLKHFRELLYPEIFHSPFTWNSILDQEYQYLYIRFQMEYSGIHFTQWLNEQYSPCSGFSKWILVCCDVYKSSSVYLLHCTYLDSCYVHIH